MQHAKSGKSYRKASGEEDFSPQKNSFSFFQTLPRCDLSQCKVEEGEEMDEENGEVVLRREPVVINGTENVEGMDNMEISSSHKEPEVDEDGFQMVSKKKGGRKK